MWVACIFPQVHFKRHSAKRFLSSWLARKTISFIQSSCNTIAKHGLLATWKWSAAHDGYQCQVCQHEQSAAHKLFKWNATRCWALDKIVPKTTTSKSLDTTLVFKGRAKLSRGYWENPLVKYKRGVPKATKKGCDERERYLLVVESHHSLDTSGNLSHQFKFRSSWVSHGPHFQN